MTDLCCGEEDFLCYVSDGAGDDTQAYPGEDVGIVPLTRMEGPPIRQRDGVKRAPAGKNAPTLQDISVAVHIPGIDLGCLEEVPLSACSTARPCTRPCWSGC